MIGMLALYVYFYSLYAFIVLPAIINHAQYLSVLVCTCHERLRAAAAQRCYCKIP